MTARGTYPAMLLNHVMVSSGQPARMAEFYASVLQMDLQGLDEEHFLCTGPGRRILFGPGEARQLGFAAFACETPAALGAVRAHILEQGAELLNSPSPLFADDAFAVKDPDGNIIAFGRDNGAEPAGLRQNALSGRLQHVVVRTTDVDRIHEFYQSVLGFKVSDRVEDDDDNLTVTFLRSDPEHHSFAAFQAPDAGLDHQSLEAKTWNDLRDWADRLAEFEIEIDWGPGRHGPGNNLFLMFKDPDGNWIEISAELARITPGQPVGVWPHNERTLNYWGRGVLRS